MCEQTEQIETIIQQHLNGNYSDSLTRFSYLNGGAEQFIRLTQNPDYTSYDRELNLIQNVLPFLQNLDSLQIIDFGVGDGRKMNLIIPNLSNVSYLGLDISPAMIDFARDDNNYRTNYFLYDFSDVAELQNLFHSLPQPRLITMLGNTITNEIDVGNYLESLRTLDSNYLLIGLELFQDNTDEIVREYRSEENYNLTFKPLEMIGIPRSHGDIEINYNSEQQRIEEWFVFNTSGQIKDIQYRSGDQILLSVTHKPTFEQIQEIIHNSGWNEEVTIVDESYALFLLS